MSLRQIPVSHSRRNNPTLQRVVIVDYNLEVDYERTEPENETVSQEEKEENSDAEYVNMDVPQAGTLHQRMMPCNALQRNQKVHQE